MVFLHGASIMDPFGMVVEEVQAQGAGQTASCRRTAPSVSAPQAQHPVAFRLDPTAAVSSQSRQHRLAI